ncbi:MAG: DNA-directed RNA polymerase subunit omega [Paludibacteraceae bacterium]|nr:DNA-directed RNA polymerase subunit omega [Paludibacteraceae bacterium]
MDLKKSKAPHNTITRDMNEMSQRVGNVYETVAIIAKRANEVSAELKHELDDKLRDFASPNDSMEEVFENREQIEISKVYERLPKPTLIATQEFIDDQLVIKNATRFK